MTTRVPYVEEEYEEEEEDHTSMKDKDVAGHCKLCCEMNHYVK